MAERTTPRQLMEDDRSFKTVAESEVTMSRLMLPEDANPMGAVHGGTIMKLVDTAAGVVAARHARSVVATVALDRMHFRHPVYVGELVTCKASMNGVGRTSMEVGVRVEAEDLLSGEVRHTCTAYLVMVALDEQGKPRPVPRLIARTPEEERRMAEAAQRREHRLAQMRNQEP